MAQSAKAKLPATYADLIKVPDNLVAELIGGELFASPRPAVPHAVAASELTVSLGGPFGRGSGGGPGGWRILYEPELHFAADVLVPDLAGWRLTRMPQAPKTAAIELPPDWICEIVSPSTGRIDRIRKMPVYARVGVQHAWLIDPLQRSLEVYRLESSHWMLVGAYENDALVRAEPFDAVELDLLPLWGEERAK